MRFLKQEVKDHLAETDAAQLSGEFDKMEPEMYFVTNTPKIIRNLALDPTENGMYLVDEDNKRKWLTNNQEEFLYLVFECADDCKTILDKAHLNAMKQFMSTITDDPLWA